MPPHKSNISANLIFGKSILSLKSKQACKTNTIATDCAKYQSFKSVFYFILKLVRLILGFRDFGKSKK